MNTTLLITLRVGVVTSLETALSPRENMRNDFKFGTHWHPNI
ncbi:MULTISPECIES: hypothetical protein [Bacillaceae]|nr:MULTISPECIES: hypothetical protein [Bacillaceae]MEA3574790.1 hypothetical protein [Peribacillus frigoritolerans]MEB2629160.1 hypothetical protein [Peribacillus frigoritolerans]